MLLNYNIKYICTIYTRLDTCRMCISRFSLRDKVTLRLLKLHFYGADVFEWSRTLDIRLSDWCCSVSIVWVQIPLTEEQTFDNTVWFNIRLKIKPNSVRIRFLSSQICGLPSTGFEPTPLIHCSTIRLALRPAPLTTRPHPLPCIYTHYIHSVVVQDFVSGRACSVNQYHYESR